jgi:hypothetical protein
MRDTASSQNTKMSASHDNLSILSTKPLHPDTRSPYKHIDGAQLVNGTFSDRIPVDSTAKSQAGNTFSTGAVGAYADASNASAKGALSSNAGPNSAGTTQSSTYSVDMAAHGLSRTASASSRGDPGSWSSHAAPGSVLGSVSKLTETPPNQGDVDAHKELLSLQGHQQRAFSNATWPRSNAYFGAPSGVLLGGASTHHITQPGRHASTHQAVAQTMGLNVPAGSEQTVPAVPTSSYHDGSYGLTHTPRNTRDSHTDICKANSSASAGSGTRASGSFTDNHTWISPRSSGVGFGDEVVARDMWIQEKLAQLEGSITNMQHLEAVRRGALSACVHMYVYIFKIRQWRPALEHAACSMRVCVRLTC